MRVPLLILAASLALAGCKNNDMHDNTANVDENLTAENIVSNDVTAIDAVTGDAANMAADVDLNYGNIDENGTPSRRTSRRRNRARPLRRARARRHSAPRLSRQRRRRRTHNNSKAGLRPCAPATRGATSADPSPA